MILFHVSNIRTLWVKQATPKCVSGLGVNIAEKHRIANNLNLKGLKVDTVCRY